jgi:hypothetical protein
VFTDDVELLRSHVTHSSARVAAVEVVSSARQHKFIGRVLQLGNRFLKRMRRAPAQTHSAAEGTKKQKIQPRAYEKQPTYRISPS